MSDTKTALPLQVLSSLEYKILKAAVERIVPEASEKFGMDLALKIESVLAGVRKEMAKEMKLLLYVFEFGAPILGFLGFRFKRFTRMSQEEKDRYLADWERSRLPIKRTGFQALKRSALAAFYGSEESWPGIGYRGPWLTRGYPHDFEGKGIQIPD